MAFRLLGLSQNIFLTNKLRAAKTLFATHYWELTHLETEIPGAVNFNVAVHESEKGIVFLRKIVKGGTDKSYGIHVARLAGLPQEVLKRSKEMLSKLEKNATREPIKSPISSKGSQMELFIPPSPMNGQAQKLIEELKALDPNHLSPLEALKKLIDWKSLYGVRS